MDVIAYSLAQTALQAGGLGHAELMRRRRELQVPFRCTELLRESFRRATEANMSRAWLLPDTTLQEEVTHFRQRQRDLKTGGPEPQLRSEISNQLGQELSIKISTALELIRLGRETDAIVRPVLLYYGCAHLCGVYSRFVFDWKERRRNHGLRLQGMGKGLSHIRLRIEDEGMFPRLVTTCFLTQGQPSAFSPLVTYSKKPTSHTSQGELLAQFGAEERGEPQKSLTFDQILEFPFASMLRPVRERHGFHKFNGLASTALLVDVMILFLASSLARYDVIAWRGILDGQDNAYRIHFDEVFDRFEGYMVDILLRYLTDPLIRLDRDLDATRRNPYSNDNRDRFQNDPNYE